MRRNSLYGILISGLILLSSCGDSQSQKHGTIVLGDPSTIVTETDSSRLQDMVTDLKPQIKPAAPEVEEPSSKPADPPSPEKPVTEAPPAQVPAPASAKMQISGPGLNADFNIMSMQVPNLDVQPAGNKNLARANGAVFIYKGGNINGNVIKVTANVTKVSQRYQSVIVLKNELGVLPLETLTKTASWQAVKGANNVYRIAGIDEKNLEYEDAGAGEIKNAVSKAASKRRYSRKKVQEWVNSVKNVRDVKQKPLHVMLKTVMWKIDGKDADGKLFSKQIRIDIPL